MKTNNLEILREEKIEHAANVSKSELMDIGFLAVPLSLLPYIRTKIIKPQAALFYAALLNFYNEDRGYAYPKQSDLCDMLGIGERSVRDYSNELEDAGLIIREKHGHAYRYYFLKPGDMEAIKSDFPDKYEEYIQRQQRYEARLQRDEQRLKAFKEGQQEYAPESKETTPQQAAAAERGADIVAASFAETSNDTEDAYAHYPDDWI